MPTVKVNEKVLGGYSMLIILNIVKHRLHVCLHLGEAVGGGDCGQQEDGCVDHGGVAAGDCVETLDTSEPF